MQHNPTHPSPAPTPSPPPQQLLAGQGGGFRPGAFVAPMPTAVAPAATPALSLTVRADGAVTLSKALLGAIAALRPGAPVDLVPPVRRGQPWHLDTRSTAARRISPRLDVARFTIPAPSREHFLRPAVPAQPGRFGGAQGTAGTHERLAFALGEEVTEQVCVRDENGRQVCERRGTGYFALRRLPG